MKKNGLKGFMVITLIAVMAIGFSFAQTLNGVGGFKDVSSTYMYHDIIQEMQKKGIINGYPDGTFKPNEKITKQHAAALISRAVPLKETVPFVQFKDVPKNHLYFEDIKKMQMAGIFEADSKGNFNPQKTLTRGEMAKALAIAFNLEVKATYDFPDVPQNHPLNEYVRALYSNGITTGDNGKFKPNDPLSRAHYAVFMHRSIHKNEDFIAQPIVETEKEVKEEQGGGQSNATPSIPPVSGNTKTVQLLYVNGKKIEYDAIFEIPAKYSHLTPDQWLAISERNIYLPIQPIVEGMGDSFSTNEYKSYIEVQQKDGTIVKLQTGKETAYINGVEKAAHSNGVTSKNVGGISYLPYDSFKSLFGYDVVLDRTHGSVFMVGGKVDYSEEIKVKPLEYKTGDPRLLKRHLLLKEWEIPTIKSRATSDKKLNANILINELGMHSRYYDDNDVIGYYPDGYNKYSSPSMFVSNNDERFEITIRLNAWDGSYVSLRSTPYVLREILIFYLGEKDGKSLFNEIDDVLSKDVVKQREVFLKTLHGKSYQFKERQVDVRRLADLSIRISYPNKSLPKLEFN